MAQQVLAPLDLQYKCINHRTATLLPVAELNSLTAVLSTPFQQFYGAVTLGCLNCDPWSMRKVKKNISLSKLFFLSDMGGKVVFSFVLFVFFEGNASAAQFHQKDSHFTWRFRPHLTVQGFDSKKSLHAGLK